MNDECECHTQELSAVIFVTNDKDALVMSANLALVSQALDMAETLA